MRRPELLLGAVVLGLAAFVGVEAARTPRGVRAASAATPDSTPAAPVERDPAAPTRATAPRMRRGGHEEIDMALSDRAARRTAAEREEIIRQVRFGAAGTWIDDAIAGRDSVVVHWRPRDIEPLRVWISPGAGVPNRRPTFDALVREAFDEWAAAGARVRVVYVPDSSSAEVPIRWVERFTEGDRVGVTHLRGRDGEVIQGAIEIATHTVKGRPLDDAWVRHIALHEVGHLFGLPHTESDSSSAMLPRGSTPRLLTPADRATMRLLYMLPVGSLRASP